MCVAKAWRNVCGVTPNALMPAAFAYFSTMHSKEFFDSLRPRMLRNSN
jgi:hypothetical protein